MSFNAKNLSYESNEPAFLRKLRIEYAGGDLARHERPLARPRKLAKEGEDDQPTYVVEGSQDTLSKADYEALMGVASDGKEDGKEAASSPQPSQGEDKPVEDSTRIPNETLQTKQKTVSIGGSNKRRFAKVVGDEEEGATSSETGDSAYTTKKSKARKGKKVKLSFDEGPEAQ